MRLEELVGGNNKELNTFKSREMDQDGYKFPYTVTDSFK